MVGRPPADLEAIDAAYRTLERRRWPDGPRCAHCGGASVSFLPPAAGTRRTRTGAPTARRVWKCATCHRQFSALTGTVLHGTRIDLPVWLSAIAALAHDGTVPNPAELVQVHGISRDAARHLHAVLVGCCAVEAVAVCLPAGRG